MKRPGSTIERILSVALTIAAVTMAGTVVHREFFAAVSTNVTANPERPLFVYDSTWSEVQQAGILVGESTAPIKIVEFVDFECPVCRIVQEQSINRIVERYGDKIAIIYVHFPLTRHRFARGAAQASECALVQGRFKEFVNVAYAKQDSFGLKPWVSYGTSAGVRDTAAFSACSREPVQFARIDSGFAVGRRKGVDGTPTFFVNGWKLSRPPSFEEWVRILDTLLAGRQLT